jgi:hypothetical protein
MTNQQEKLQTIQELMEALQELTNELENLQTKHSDENDLKQFIKLAEQKIKQQKELLIKKFAK